MGIDSITYYFSTYPFFIGTGIIIVVWIIFALLLSILYSRLLKSSSLQSKFGIPVRRLLQVFYKPIQISLALLMGYILSNILSSHIPDEINTYIRLSFRTTIICWVSWLLIHLSNHLLLSLCYNKKITHFFPFFSQINISSFRRAISAIIVISSFLIILNEFGYDISVLLMFGGIGGLIVGLAFQQILSNTFASIIFFTTKPIQEGQLISSEELGIEGTIEKIGWRVTHIRYYDTSLKIFPNQRLADSVVTNLSACSHRRIRESIPIQYRDIHILPQIRDEITSLILTLDYVDPEKEISIYITKFHPLMVEVLCQFFLNNMDWKIYTETKHLFLSLSVGELKKIGIELAYPINPSHYYGFSPHSS